MLYLTRRLHLVSGEVLHMQVVEVVGGVVRGFVPFEIERQSMLWVEEGFLSFSSCAGVLGDLTFSAGDGSLSGPLFFYSCVGDDCSFSSPVVRMG